MTPGDYVTTAIRLVRQIAQGGMGSIWIAEHERLHMPVVVKFITGDFVSHAETLERFEREATLAAQAKSPHVVQVFDHGVSLSGYPYIAMELLEGEDLGTLIEREGRVDPGLFLRIFEQATAGVSRAHAKAIVHRDIKPENIFLCSEDGDLLVKILDFGIAKGGASHSFNATQSGALMGTAYYMSPEQTMGSAEIDLRSDLWALGVVAYYALTGERPFEADALGPLVFAIATGKFVPPSQRNPDLGPAIDAWMNRSLALNPAHRFASAKQMAAALHEAVTGHSMADSSERLSLSLSTSQLWTSSTLSPLQSTQVSSVGPARLRPRWWLLAPVAGAATLLVALWVTNASEPGEALVSVASPALVDPTEIPAPTLEAARDHAALGPDAAAAPGSAGPGVDPAPPPVPATTSSAVVSAKRKRETPTARDVAPSYLAAKPRAHALEMDLK